MTVSDVIGAMLELVRIILYFSGSCSMRKI